jgi:hypothetical protein
MKGAVSRVRKKPRVREASDAGLRRALWGRCVWPRAQRLTFKLLQLKRQSP